MFTGFQNYKIIGFQNGIKVEWKRMKKHEKLVCSLLPDQSYLPDLKTFRQLL